MGLVWGERTGKGSWLTKAFNHDVDTYRCAASTSLLKNTAVRFAEDLKNKLEQIQANL